MRLIYHKARLCLFKEELQVLNVIESSIEAITAKIATSATMMRISMLLNCAFGALNTIEQNLENGRTDRTRTRVLSDEQSERLLESVY